MQFLKLVGGVAVGILVAIVALAALLSSSVETASTVDKPDAAVTSKASKDGGEAASAREPDVAAVGDVITLNGNAQGSRMAVRLVDVVDPIRGGQFDQPDAGKRYVGVKVRMSNRGSAAYDDSPMNGAQLLISGDVQASPTILSGGQCEMQFATSATISPNSKQSGCLAFQVPDGKSPKMFQFALDSGFGPATGEWRIK